MSDLATTLTPEEELERLIPRPTLLDRVQRQLHAHPAIGPFIVLVSSCIVFGLLNSRFVTAVNISLMLQQVAVVAALGVAQTLVILTAGIDLSIGAAMIVAQLVMAHLAANDHVDDGVRPVQCGAHGALAVRPAEDDPYGVSEASAKLGREGDRGKCLVERRRESDDCGRSGGDLVGHALEERRDERAERECRVDDVLGHSGLP